MPRHSGPCRSQASYCPDLLSPALIPYGVLNISLYVLRENSGMGTPPIVLLDRATTTPPLANCSDNGLKERIGQSGNVAVVSLSPSMPLLCNRDKRVE